MSDNGTDNGTERYGQNPAGIILWTISNDFIPVYWKTLRSGLKSKI